MIRLRVALLRAYSTAFRAVSGFLARRLRQNFYLHLAGVFTLFALVDVLFLHQIVDMRQRTYDLVVKNRFARPAPDPALIIVDIDEKSLAAMAKDYGRWPWPRQVLGEFVENVNRQKPKAIVFDILFSDPDVYNPDSDAYFNEVIAGTTNTFFPYLRLAPKDDALSRLPVAAIPGVTRTDDAQDGRTIAVVLPYFKSVLSGGRLGTFNVEPDPDGIIRQYPAWMEAYGWQLPSLPLRVGHALGAPSPGRHRILLNWRGPPFTYRTASFSDVYLDMLNKDRTRPVDEFKDRIVVIGSTAAGLGDIKPTSMARQFPGVEILATAIDNVVHGDFIRVPTTRWPHFVVALLIVWGTAFAFYRAMEPDLFARVFGLSQIGLLVISYLSINLSNFFFDLTGPVFLGFVYFSVAKVYAMATARALERNVVVESLRGGGTQVATMAVVVIAGTNDTSTAIFMRALKKAIDRHGGLAKDVEVVRGKQRGVFGLFESMLVVSWVCPRDDAGGLAQIEREADALLKAVPELVQRHRIAGESVESTAVHRLALGGTRGRVTPGEWRRLFGETLARSSTERT